MTEPRPLKSGRHLGIAAIRKSGAGVPLPTPDSAYRRIAYHSLIESRAALIRLTGHDTQARNQPAVGYQLSRGISSASVLRPSQRRQRSGSLLGRDQCSDCLDFIAVLPIVNDISPSLIPNHPNIPPDAASRLFASSHVPTMRPGIGLESGEPRPRKSSNAESPSLTGDRYCPSPTTFFLSRDPDAAKPSTERSAGAPPSTSAVSTLQDVIQEADRPMKHTAPRAAEARSGSRRRSTIKPGHCERFRRGSSTASAEAIRPEPERGVTPSPLPSRDVSLPSSPKSVSTRSLQKSDDELTNDESGSQAILSSEEDEGEISGVVQDSQPELIMPSIKMPSRRPFTQRGKDLGRFKIMVAGRKGNLTPVRSNRRALTQIPGVGKTSLIKSIIQLCEDIVHVDPMLSSSTRVSQRGSGGSFDLVHEVYASTKPYPAWWSNIEESRILRRRKSMGDSVLERNVCFVDTSDSTKVEKLIHYAEQQLVSAMSAVDQLSNEFSGMLSGRGSSQVDVVLYLISKGIFEMFAE